MSQSLLERIVRLLLRALLKPMLGPPLPLRAQRALLSIVGRLGPTPGDVSGARVTGLEVPTWRFAAGRDDPARRPAILWCHGGAFVLGDHRSHGGWMKHVAAASGADVYLPEYRLAPEHPHPAAVDDLFSAYRAVLARGHDPGRVAIAGDSAGGALAILTALAIIDMDVPRPAAMVLCSPVTDLALSGSTIETRARVDPVLRREFLEHGYRGFAGPLALTDPRVSPLYAALGSLPPTLIQVGEDEMLLDDSLRFADRAWGADVEAELERFPGMWHAFQGFAGVIAVGAGAIDDIAGFLRRRWSTSSGRAAPDPQAGSETSSA